MVSVVSGGGLGLLNSSRYTVGGELGQASQGRAGERVTVNAANGNLVIQNQDGQLAGIGADIALLRTYNSQGGWDGDNGDAWRLGYYRRISGLTGTLNAAGSTLRRTDADGFESTYTWRDGRYVGIDGAGSYDSLVVAGGAATWTDGDTGLTETYAESTAGTWRLTQITDPDGHAIKLTYDAQGLIASLSTWKAGATSADETLTLAYDAAKRLTQVRTTTRRADGTLATQTRTYYTYDSAGRLSGVITDLSPEDNSTADGRSYNVNYTYDSAGRVRTVTQTDGTALTIAYDGSGRVSQLTDALGRLTTFSYDSTARQTTVTDALNQTTRLSYDSAGRLSDLSGTGFKNSLAYDADGNVLSSTNGLGQQTQFAYDSHGNLIRSTDATGRVLERSYDAANRQTSETQSAQTTRYVYDTTGGLRRLRFTVSAEGRVSEQQYNSLGQLSSSLAHTHSAYTGAATLADLTAWAAQQTAPQRADYSYDLRGQLASRTDASGLTRYTFDAFGRLLQSIDASGNTTAYVYDGLDRLTLSTDALGATTVTSYDDAGNRTSVQLANGLRTVSTYNLAGLLIAQSQFSGSTALGETRYAYDAANRLRMTQDPTGQRQWLLYDEAGRKVGDVDALGHLTETRYDAAGRAIQSLGYEQPVNTALLVDAQGNPAAVSLAAIRPATSAGDRRQWQLYDAAGRATHQITSLGEVTETQYDGAGRVSTVIQHGQRLSALPAPGSNDLPVLAYAAGDPDRITRNLYDADGLLRGTLDAEGYFTERRYDAAGRLIERVAYATATDAAQRSTGTLAQLMPAAHSSDRRSVWLYDAQGRIQAEIDPDGFLTETTYNSADQRTQSLRYARRITGSASSTSTLASLRPTSSAEDHGTRWTYDALARVQTETAADGTVTRYSYDSVGNLTSTERAVGTAEVRSHTARYDVQGRLTAELSAEGAAKLASAGTQEQIDAVWASYATRHAYDAAGRRIRSTDARGSTTVFYYDAAGRQVYRILKSPQGGEVQASRYTGFGETALSVSYTRRLSADYTATLTGGLADATLDSKITALADSSDQRTQANYNQRGLIQQAIDALGFKTDTTYNAFGQVRRSDAAAGSAVGDGRVLRTDYTYDRRGLLTATAQDPQSLNLQTRAEYDAFGRQTASVDARGTRSSTQYLANDSSGRQVVLTDATGARSTTVYDAFDRVVRRTDALGYSITFTHDTANRRVTMTDALGIQTVTESTRHGQVARVTDGTGASTTYRYDKNGNLLSRTDALGNVTSSSYDAADNLVAQSNPGTAVTRFTYDAANRLLTRQVDPDGLNLRTAYEYDGQGRAVKVTDAAGTVTSYRFDAKGELTEIVVDDAATGLKLRTTTTYDAKGRTLSVTEGAGTAAAKTTEYRYDLLGRRTQEVVDPAALKLTTAYDYDAAGNVVARRDAVGAVTRYAYDAAGRQTHIMDALGAVTEQRYDAAGRVVETIRYAKPIGRNLVNLPYVTDSRIQPAPSEAAGLPAGETVYLATDRDGFVGDWFTVKEGEQIDLSVEALAEKVSPSSQFGIGLYYSVDGVNFNAFIRAATLDSGSASGIVAGRLTVPAGYKYARVMVQLAGPWGQTGSRYFRNIEATRVGSTADVIPAKADLAALVKQQLLSSAADQHTRYAYDAAGRQTHVMDALGAVTEQRYDAAGRVVDTIRYAKPIGRNLVNLPYVADSRIQAAASEAAGLPAGETVYLATDRDGFVGDWFTVKEGEQIDLSVEALAEKVSPSSLFGIGLYYSVDGVNFNAFIRAATLDSGSASGIVAGRLTVPAGYKYARVMVQLAGPWGQTGSRYFRNIEATRVGSTADVIPAKADLAALVKQQLLSSAADQHTRYAYDAAGRQTHFMDALGAVTEQRYDAAGRVVETIRYAKPIGRNLVNLPYVTDSRIQPAPSEAAGLPAGETVYLATDRDGFVGDWFAVKEGEQIDLSVEALAEKVSPSSLFGIGLYYSVDGVNFNAFIRAATLDSGSASGIVAGRLTVPAGYKYARVMVQLAGPWGQTGSRYFRNIEATRVGSTADVIPAKADLAALVKLQLLSSAADQHTRYAYDAAGRQTHVMDALGAVTEQRYDAAGRVVESIRYAKPIGRNLVNLPYVTDSRIQPAPSEAAGLPAGETVYLATDRDGFVGDWFTVKEGEQIDLSVEALAEKVSPSSQFGIGLYYSVDGVNFNAFIRAATLDSGSASGIVAGRLTVPAGYKYARVMVQLAGPWGQTGSRYFRNIEATRVGSTADVIPAKADLAALVKLQLLSSAADQHTRYAYDAAGRQTHFMDALGAVTEQRYDAAGRVVDTIRYAKPIGRNLVNLPYVADSRIQPAPSEAAGLPAGETVYLATDRDGFVGDWFTVKEGEQIDLSVEALAEKVSPSSQFGIGLYYSVDGVNFNAFIRAATLDSGSASGIVAGRLTVPAGYKYARVMVQLAGPWGQTGSRYFRNIEVTRVGSTADVIPAKADLATLVKQQLLSSAADQHTRYAYDSLGRPTHQLDPENYLTVNRYDASGNLTETIKYASRVQRPEALAQTPGSQVTILRASDPIPPTGAYLIEDPTQTRRTLYEYTALNQLRRTTDAEGHTESTTYNAFGDAASSTNKLGGTAAFQYDNLGRLIQETLPIQSRLPNGTLTPVVNRYEYDTRGNRIRTIEAAGLPEQRITTFTYDALGRQVSETGEAVTVYKAGVGYATTTPTTTRRYDTAGNLIELTDPNGNRTRSWYDALNRKIAEVNAAGILSTWQRDAAGNVAMQRVYADPVLDPSLAATTPMPASAPTPTAANIPRETRFTYDTLNRQTEARVTGLDLRRYAEAADGSLIESTSSFARVAQVYDAAGNLVKSIDGNGGITYSFYDRSNSKILEIDAEGYAIAWTRGVNGTLLRETRFARRHPSPATITETSAPAALLASWPTDPADRITEFTYDRAGRLITESRLNVAFGRVDAATGALAEAVGSATRRYAYDGMDHKVREIDANGAQTDWLYDAAGRLLRQQAAATTDFEGTVVRATTDYEYDGLNNATRVVRRGKDASSETDDQIQRFSYGTGGRLLTQTDALGQVTTLSQDAAGNLTLRRYTRVDADGMATTEASAYRYDALNREVMRQTLWQAGAQPGGVPAAGPWQTGDTQETRYNAWGEVTGRRTNGGNAAGEWQESAEYNALGKVQKTNAAADVQGGITKVFLYDANGNATVSIQSAGADLQPLSLAQVLASTATYRTLTLYDRRNQVVSVRQPRMDGTHDLLDIRQVVTQQAQDFSSGSPQVNNLGAVLSTQPAGATPPPVLTDAQRFQTLATSVNWAPVAYDDGESGYAYTGVAINSVAVNFSAQAVGQSLGAWNSVKVRVNYSLSGSTVASGSREVVVYNKDALSAVVNLGLSADVANVNFSYTVTVTYQYLGTTPPVTVATGQAASRLAWLSTEQVSDGEGGYTAVVQNNFAASSAANTSFKTVDLGALASVVPGADFSVWQDKAGADTLSATVSWGLSTDGEGGYTGVVVDSVTVTVPTASLMETAGALAKATVYVDYALGNGPLQTKRFDFTSNSATYQVTVPLGLSAGLGTLNFRYNVRVAYAVGTNPQRLLVANATELSVPIEWVTSTQVSDGEGGYNTVTTQHFAAAGAFNRSFYAATANKTWFTGEAQLREATKAYFYYRTSATGPYTGVVMERGNVAFDNATDSTTTPLPGAFYVWNSWLPAGIVDYKIVAMNDTTVTGSFNGTLVGASLRLSSASRAQVGQVFFDSYPAMHFFDQGSVLKNTDGKLEVTTPRLAVQYRRTGSSDAWVRQEVASYQPGGWFSWPWQAAGLSGAYDLRILRLDAAGNVQSRLFTQVNLTATPSATALVPYAESDIVFGNQPASAVSLSFRYRPAGSTGAWISTAFTKRGDGVFGRDFQSDNLLPLVTPTSQYDYEYQYDALDAGGQVVNGATGVLRITPNAKQFLSHTGTRAPTVVSFVIEPPNALKMALRYRLLGSGAAYSTLTLTRSSNATPFQWNASTLTPATGAASYEYEYRLLDGAGNPVRNPVGEAIVVQGTATVGQVAQQAPQTDWVTTGSVQTANTIVRRQASNAFGEVQSETDGRGNTTTLGYNTLGQLVLKLDPQTDVTGENGVATRATPLTRYAYDLAGRAVATRDANGFLRTQVWQEGLMQPQVASEFYADGDRANTAQGGRADKAYDIFGNLRSSTDAEGRQTRYRYDKNDQLVRLDRPTRGSGQYLAAQASWEQYEYDSQGQRIAATTVLGRSRQYYDLQGRVSRTTSIEGRSTSYAYTWDATITGAGGRQVGGWRKTTTAPGALVAIEKSDVFGRMTWRQDYGGRVFSYGYNLAGWLMSQSSTLAGQAQQSLSYEYFANGYLKRQTDQVTRLQSNYAYDDNGNRVFEEARRSDNASAVYYSSSISYDELNRVRLVKDQQYTITTRYDAAGNRRNVHSYYQDGVDGSQRTQDLWYLYDPMNRFTVTMGELKDGRITRGSTGKLIAYNKAGERTVAEYTAEDGKTQYRERYTYTSDGYLQDMFRSTWNGSSFVEQTPPAATRQTDLAGRVLSYTERGADNSIRSNLGREYDRDNRQLKEYDYTKLKDGRPRTDTYGYNADGTLAQIVTSNVDTVLTRRYSYEWWDSAQQKSITLQAQNEAAPGWDKGTSLFTYDVNGHLTRATDVQGQRTIQYVSDADGQILYREELAARSGVAGDWHWFSDSDHSLGGEAVAGEVTRKRHYYYLSGHRIGDVNNEGAALSRPNGVDYAEALAQSKTAEPTKFTPTAYANFDANYQAINESYPGPTGTDYTVQKGDTLQGIAERLWGDRSLWYLIAEANGLAGAETLTEGQVLAIPNKVTNIHNNSGTVGVYDAGAAIGDTSPTLPAPPPPPKNGCGALGMVLMIVIVVVVSIYTAGAAAGAMSVATGSATTFGAGLTVLSGGAGFGAAALGAAAIGGAVGNIAGQGFAIAAGMQKSIDWRSVGQSAIGAGITAGVGAGLNAAGWLTSGSAAVNAAGRAALGTGANLLRQEKWNWQSVMASAAGAAAGTLVGQALGNSEWGRVLGPQGLQTAAGFAGGVVSGWAGPGGKTDYLSVFASAAASSYGGGPGQQRGGRSDQELDLNGGPAPGAGAQEFYEQFVQQATAREDGPEPSLAGATQYAQARLLSVVEGSGRDRLNIGSIDERIDALARAAMARSQARDRAASLADINAQLQQLKASIDKSQALANMQALADAYRASGMVGATGDPQPYLFTVQSATLAAAASQPLTPSMQAVGVAAESGLRAVAEIPLAVVDLAQAGVGAAITATTGYVPDLTMYSGMGRSAQEGAGTGEMLQNMNPMLGLFIGTDQALYGLLQGDTRPLASLSGSLLGGGLAGRVTPSMPGYRPGVWSPGTVRAGQFAAEAMPRLSPSGPMGLRAQMGAAGDLPTGRATVAIGTVGNATTSTMEATAGTSRMVPPQLKGLAAGQPLPDGLEIVVLGNTNKPGNFILRPGIDDKPIGGIVASGKSVSIASDLEITNEYRKMFGSGRAMVRGDTLSGAFTEDIRAAGFEVLYAPTDKNPFHARIVGVGSTFDEAGRDYLSLAFDRLARQKSGKP